MVPGSSQRAKDWHSRPYSPYLYQRQSQKPILYLEIESHLNSNPSRGVLLPFEKTRGQDASSARAKVKGNTSASFPPMITSYRVVQCQCIHHSPHSSLVSRSENINHPIFATPSVLLYLAQCKAFYAEDLHSLIHYQSARASERS